MIADLFWKNTTETLPGRMIQPTAFYCISRLCHRGINDEWRRWFDSSETQSAEAASQRSRRFGWPSPTPLPNSPYNKRTKCCKRYWNGLGRLKNVWRTLGACWYNDRETNPWPSSLSSLLRTRSPGRDFGTNLLARIARAIVPHLICRREYNNVRKVMVG